MNTEVLHTLLLFDPASPDYGVARLLYSYYIPVRRYSPSPHQVIETFWTDDTFHIVAFHSEEEAWEYIETVKAGREAEYLPSQTYARYREWEKKQHE